MTCPQCSNNLPDTATFCPKCGSTFQPVPFSYLPAGAPAWPTSLPSRPLYATATASSAENELRSASQPTTKPRRSTSSILTMLALFILTPLVGIGATLGVLWANGQIGGGPAHASIHVPAVSQKTPTANTPTPAGTSSAQGNQLPTPTAFQTATSPQLGITVKYPSDWVQEAPQTTSDSNSFSVHPQSTQHLGISFYFQRFSTNFSSTITSTTNLNQSNIASFGSLQGVHNLQPITSPAPQRTIGGVAWDEQDASFTNDNGTLFHFTTLSVNHNKLYYNITFYSPDVYYNEAMQKYFQPILDSFQFQS
jgi:zinc-ribbon domain